MVITSDHTVSYQIWYKLQKIVKFRVQFTHVGAQITKLMVLDSDEISGSDIWLDSSFCHLGFLKKNKKRLNILVIEEALRISHVKISSLFSLNYVIVRSMLFSLCFSLVLFLFSCYQSLLVSLVTDYVIVCFHSF